jgi:hypothetical protein
MCVCLYLTQERAAAESSKKVVWVYAASLNPISEANFFKSKLQYVHMPSHHNSLVGLQLTGIVTALCTSWLIS